MKLLDAQQVLEIHEHLLMRDGGLPGIRLGRSVEAVLGRVENNLRFEFEANVTNAAALFAFTFAVGHIFNDANKDEIDQIGLEQAIIAAARGDLEVEDFVGAFQKLV